MILKKLYLKCVEEGVVSQLRSLNVCFHLQEKKNWPDLTMCYSRRVKPLFRLIIKSFLGNYYISLKKENTYMLCFQLKRVGDRSFRA